MSSTMNIIAVLLCIVNMLCPIFFVRTALVFGTFPLLIDGEPQVMGDIMLQSELMKHQIGGAARSSAENGQ